MANTQLEMYGLHSVSSFRADESDTHGTHVYVIGDRKEGSNKLITSIDLSQLTRIQNCWTVFRWFYICLDYNCVAQNDIAINGVDLGSKTLAKCRTRTQRIVDIRVPRMEIMW